MIPYVVQIGGNGAFHIRRHVIAPSAKEALLAVIRSLPDTNCKPLPGEPDPAAVWNSPGWSINVFPSREAIILNS